MSTLSWGPNILFLRSVSDFSTTAGSLATGMASTLSGGEVWWQNIGDPWTTVSDFSTTAGSLATGMISTLSGGEVRWRIVEDHWITGFRSERRGSEEGRKPIKILMNTQTIANDIICLIEDPANRDSVVVVRGRLAISRSVIQMYSDNRKLELTG